MSLLKKESIQAIAETQGIANLKEDVASSVASDVEYRLREIIQEALKFMRHSKRTKLSTQDVNHALRLRNVESLYGFSSSDPIVFTKAIGPGEIYFVEDEELEFDDIINAALPPCPLEMSLSTHWLAVEGVQPEIPENPSSEAIKQLEAVETTLPKCRKRKLADTEDKDTEPKVKTTVKHVLSKELQLYFTKITDAIKSDQEDLKRVALKSLCEDPGLHQLLPYFSQWILTEVTNCLRNLPFLTSVMRMVWHLLENPYLHIELYLHQLMPAVLTCLVGRRLCEHATENHWGLREFVAGVIALTCKRYGPAYPSLQPRIVKTLVHALLDHKKPLTSHYGAIVGLKALGLPVIEAILIPNAKLYITTIKRIIETAEAPARVAEAKKCYQAMLVAVGEFVKHKTSSKEDSKEPAIVEIVPDLRVQVSDLLELFGEDLQPYVQTPEAQATV